MSKIIDDGFNSYLVETAFFDGIMEIPILKKPEKFIIPTGMVPFTCRNRSKNYQDFVCFYEHDIKFARVIRTTKKFLEDLRRFPGVISPDCSLYIDMPFCLQIVNVYRNRAVAYFLQEQGIYVIPNVRWGDERSYTKCELGEKVAFLGLPHHSIVSVGTYGCIRRKEDKYYFREGLIAMLDELEPEIVLVYGRMPDSIFGELRHRTKFIQFTDWITRKKAGGY